MNGFIDDGGPAFPRRVTRGGVVMREYPGMSLRDWFAGRALGSIATHGIAAHEPPETIAETCYLLADAMLKARSR